MDEQELSSAIRDLTTEVSKLRQVLVQFLEHPQRGIDSSPVPGRSVEMPPEDIKPLSSANSDEPQNAIVAEVHKLLSKMFSAALDENEEQAFEIFVECMHSDRVDAPRSIPSLREFNWKSIRKNVARYLLSPDLAGSFSLDRTQPAEPSSETRSLKVFLKCEGRSPVPVTFKRDAASDNAFRVTDSSL
jgi:hypothetical protein